ncbi:MAG: hypothetical protein AAF738_02100 [Bacteroidota bacterium]
MKNIILNSTTFLLAFAFLFTACEEDPIIGDNDTDEKPITSLVTAEGFISSYEIIEIGTPLPVRLEYTAGTDDLQSLTILEDGEIIDASRLTIEGVETANNPQIITNKRSGTFDITIAPNPNITEPRLYTYAFQVSDNTNIAEALLNIETIIPDVVTPLDQTLVGVLLNQAGPAGTGGLDLDTGESTGSGAAAAEIQDEGIDFDKVAAENWRRQIAGVNGAVVRKADLFLVSDGLTFDQVDSKEQVLAAYDSSSALTGFDDFQNPSDTNTGELVSQPIQIGDMFAVYSASNERYYLLLCTNIDETTNNNNDSYTFSIKY